MTSRVLVSGVLLIAGALYAQQPVATGKFDPSATNYRGSSGSALNKHSSDDDLVRGLDAAYSNAPEFANVLVHAKHHNVTLSGTVESKEAKKRAEKIALTTAGVRNVQNRLKVVATPTQTVVAN